MVKLLLLVALVVPGAAIAADGRAVPGKGCLPTVPQYTGTTGKAAYHRLDQLPPAAEILTVIHSVDGCSRPVVVQYGIGGNPALGGGRGR